MILTFMDDPRQLFHPRFANDVATSVATCFSWLTSWSQYAASAFDETRNLQVLYFGLSPLPVTVANEGL